jgi:hypothetical protein
MQVAPPPPPRREALFDIECYRNYFLIKFKFTDTGEYLDFPMWGGLPLDLPALRSVVATSTIHGFNSNNYDVPQLCLALAGATCAMLKGASDRIIMGRMKPWEYMREYNVEIPPFLDHVDLMEIAPGVGVGLKMYGGRMHSRKMQDLPIEPGAMIEPEQRSILAAYCGNDLDLTHDLLNANRDRLGLRKKVSIEYGVDCRSRSDAQIAEAAIRAKLPFKPQRPFWPHGSTFHYSAPDYIQFSTAELREVLRLVTTIPFVVNDKEQVADADDPIKTGVQLPPEIKGRDIVIGSSKYRLGIGGLHSQESQRISRTIPGTVTISDHDVASYYPSLILQLGMFPKQLGPAFLQIYENIYHERLAAKHSGNKTVADGYKIVLNGTFGKLGSKYSILFAPDLMIRVTITGQLCLLMLIEQLEQCGIPVVSANTDGIVLATPAGMESVRDGIMAWWQATTSLELEMTSYAALYSRDVNNYLAVKPDGKMKGKGVYATSGVLENKHPSKDICLDAVKAYLGAGAPVAATVCACQDIRKFLVIRQVKGGGNWKDGYLGKAVRWYYSTDGAPILYVSNGNKVAGSDGCRPLMELPDLMPTDVDLQHYIDAANDMLRDLGLTIPLN